jgi:hypothetical protein
MQWNVSPERLARLKRVVPKGAIRVVKITPLRGEELQPLSPRDLGLRERRAA